MKMFRRRFKRITQFAINANNTLRMFEPIKNRFPIVMQSRERRNVTGRKCGSLSLATKLAINF